MSNYKVLFSLKVLKGILATFVESFFILYFFEVSEKNILPLAVYKLIAFTTVFAVSFLTRNYCKRAGRINLMRIGIVLNFIYFLTIILLRENIVNHVYLIGFIYGLEEGFYYSIYNTIESDAISNKERAKFTGHFEALRAILSVAFPLVFGYVIYSSGFTNSLLVVLGICAIEILLSLCIKDENIPEGKRTNLKEFKDIIKKTPELKQIYRNRMISGLTYSKGAFSYIVTIYIIQVFSNSVSLGIFTSIFSLISCMIGLMFAKCIKTKHYKGTIKVSMAFTIASLCLMIYKCNFITIVIYNLCQTFSKGLLDLINNNSAANISNLETIRKEYKVEYWLGIEGCLFIGRTISNILLILIVYIGSNIMMYIFVIFLAMLAASSVKLQDTINYSKV